MYKVAFKLAVQGLSKSAGFKLSPEVLATLGGSGLGAMIGAGIGGEKNWGCGALIGAGIGGATGYGVGAWNAYTKRRREAEGDEASLSAFKLPLKGIRWGWNKAQNGLTNMIYNARYKDDVEAEAARVDNLNRVKRELSAERKARREAEAAAQQQ